MRIHRLRMQNYRGFEDAELDLERRLTVLFGVNGSGKSSVLTACACCISEIHNVGASSQGSWLLWTTDDDVRHGGEKLALEATFANGNAVRVIRPRHGRLRDSRTLSNVDASALRNEGSTLAVFYGASRDVAQAMDAFATSNGDRVDALRPASATHDALVAGNLKFRSFFQWFKAREDIENEQKVARQDLSFEDTELAAVRRAVVSMLPGFSGLRIRRDPLGLIVHKGDGVFAVDQLSDGEKLVLVLAADLARRLATTCPPGMDPLHGEAIVLVDEIELHLHPQWQRRVLGDLLHTFPGCQFIVTTHSPQVLSEVDNDAVVQVDAFTFTRPGSPIAGRDSNAILTEAMATPERPAKQMAAIEEISRRIDDGDLDGARAKLDVLAVELTEADREVVGLRTMLHFLGESDEAHSKRE